MANVLLFLSLNLAADIALIYNPDVFLIFWRLGWCGMHLFVILGYLLVYFQIRKYYREIIARHEEHLTEHDRDQISSDLRSLIVLFASFSIYALVLISVEILHYSESSYNIA